MNKIQMVDLFNQYLSIKSEIDSAIQETIEKGAFINGDAVHLFRDELASYLNIDHVITCGNGTDALQVAMMALDLQPGDEVITSNFTFIASVEVISLLGLKPVLVDVNPDTFNIQANLIRKAITKKTKAIVPVHLFGQVSEMDEIMKIGQEFGIPVIEDNAQAIGAKYTFSDGHSQHAGTIGEIGTTSFFPSKNLGCFGDGGAIFTKDEKLAKKIRMIVNHGSKIKYYHDLIGVNSRLDTIQAAILRIKLGLLDQYNAARQKAARFYDDHLHSHSEIIIPHRTETSDHIFHQYTLRILNGKRDNLKSLLAQKGIPSMVYYPMPISRQKAFSSAGYKKDDFPVTEKLCSEVLSLPMHTELKDDQLDYIVKTLLNSI